LLISSRLFRKSASRNRDTSFGREGMGGKMPQVWNFRENYGSVSAIQLEIEIIRLAGSSGPPDSAGLPMPRMHRHPWRWTGIFPESSKDFPE
jgi:hypothetical protein